MMSFGGCPGAYWLIISATFVRSCRSGSFRQFQSIVVSVFEQSTNCDKRLFTRLSNCQGFKAQTLHVSLYPPTPLSDPRTSGKTAVSQTKELAFNMMFKAPSLANSLEAVRNRMDACR